MKSRKRNFVTEAIVLVKKEMKDLLDCIAFLDTDITKYIFEAEKKKDFTLLTSECFSKKQNGEGKISCSS